MTINEFIYTLNQGYEETKDQLEKIATSPGAGAQSIAKMALMRLEKRHKALLGAIKDGMAEPPHQEYVVLRDDGITGDLGSPPRYADFGVAKAEACRLTEDTGVYHFVETLVARGGPFTPRLVSASHH